MRCYNPWQVRWLLSLLILLAVMFGRVHPCQAVYVLPDGTTCQACLDLEHGDSGNILTLGTGDHGDCHDCCQLVTCLDEHTDDPALTSPILIPAPAALLSCGCQMVLPTRQAFTPILSEVANAPIHGPPDRVDARGPPSSTLA